LSCMKEKIVYHDRNMKIRWANQSACEFYQMPLEKMIGQVCYALLNRPEQECRTCPVKETIKTSACSQNVLTFTGGKTLLINAYPVFDDQGLIGVVEVSLDITDRTEIEREIRKEKEDSLAASEAKSRFLANVSHEIRTLMNVILGMANLVYESTKDGEQKEYLDMIRDSTSFLLSLVNDLLDISKIEAGRFELVKEPFDLHRQVKKTVSSFSLQAEKKGLVLSCSVDDSVPGHVLGDAGRLQQVLINLIGNAIKFTNRGEVAVTVRLAEAEETGAREAVTGEAGTVPVTFSVSDTGIGIPAKKIDEMFQDFSHFESAHLDSKYEGTGLGLPISRNLVAMMGGEIKVTSAVNKGSIFYFTIPITVDRISGKEEKCQTEDERDREPDICPPEQEEEGLDILLVEDKRMNQKLATVLLERKGHHVFTAKNGREALDKIKARQFDAVLMDIHMPVMDGWKATELIRAAEEGQERHTIIIAMTASAMPEDRDKCRKAGMDYYISKPINSDELYEVLSRVRRVRSYR
jgi:two-component system, sensor histidine kinase and response regulator